MFDLTFNVTCSIAGIFERLDLVMTTQAEFKMQLDSINQIFGNALAGLTTDIAKLTAAIAASQNVSQDVLDAAAALQVRADAFAALDAQNP